MDFRASSARAVKTWDGGIEVTFTVDRESVVAFEHAYGEISNLSEIEVEAKKHRKKRSLDANSYFHVLCNKIAAKLGAGDDETKKRLNLEYGTLAKNSDGTIVAAILPEGVDASCYYDYFKAYARKRIENTECICYKAYKRTRELNSSEMARLIEGTIYEAQRLGIDTATPDEQALMIKRWEEIRA